MPGCGPASRLPPYTPGGPERARLDGDGFDPDDPHQAVPRRIMGSGWQGIGDRMSEVIEESLV
ncbi:MAG: hypothetical protein GEV03_29105 [Streptosporangiales bacterium]|nr:hypothetical protein [Streptosporangiales bacterium]